TQLTALQEENHSPSGSKEITYTHVWIRANRGAQKPQESLQSHGSFGVSQTAYLHCSDTRIIRLCIADA
ncbi:hypothetical protein, partial [Bifidobacterium longum]|uniref:hypothetical protein n=1 Tax=Bifidobacterium longum TaxID=216816 RepID=UPI0019D34E3E